MTRKDSTKKHGDTIIEVTLSITIFSLIAVLSLNLMNNGVSNAQRTLEITMARNEIDAQAEALRYIHSSYVAERQLSRDQSQFRKLWDALRSAAVGEEDLEDDDEFDTIKFDINSLNSCSEAYGTDDSFAQAGSAVYSMNSFVLNTRLLLPDTDTTYAGESYDTLMKDIVVGVEGLRLVDEEGNQIANKLYAPSLYPRIIYSSIGDSDRGIGDNDNFDATNENGSLAEDKIYNRISRAEGIWIVAAGDGSNLTTSSFYDFYIRTCWHSVGDKIPSTITTIVRLYNPEVIE